MKNKLSFYNKTFLRIAPALLLGMAAMIVHEVSFLIWIQNPAAIVIGSVLILAFLPEQYRLKRQIVMAAAVVLLLLTLPGEGIDGVHRWIRLPGFQLNIAMIILPAAILSVSELLREGKSDFVLAEISIIAFLLFLQPDASQLAGFVLPVLFLLLSKKAKGWGRYVTGFLLLWLVILVWFKADPLEPVAHVEGIVGLLAQISPFLGILGIAALVFVPVSFLIWPFHGDRRSSVLLALYNGAVIAAAGLGNFPVPFMGYGLSPVIGYLLVIVISKARQEAQQ